MGTDMGYGHGPSTALGRLWEKYLRLAQVPCSSYLPFEDVALIGGGVWQYLLRISWLTISRKGVCLRCTLEQRGEIA